MNAQSSATCFHCGEPIPPGVSLMARLDPPQPMCCAGCCAVAELIAGAGLADYYRYRREPGNKSDMVTDDRWQGYAQPDVADAFVSHAGGTDTALIMIDDLRCSACVWLIERHLRQISGVVTAQVNPVTQRARIQWRHDALNLAQVLRHLAALGYHPKPLTHDRSGTTIQESQQAERRAAQKRLGVAALGMMQVMMYALPLYVREQTRMEESVAAMLSWISLIITTPVLLYSGLPFLVSAWRVLKHRRINMDVPVALALVLAFIASLANLLHGTGVTYFDSIVMFVFLLSLGRYVEMTVRHRTGSVTDALSRLQPDLAHRVELQDGVETTRDVPVAHLQCGDVLLVRNGEVVPADGVVLNNNAQREPVQLNEALLTGESLPVVRHAGDTAIAGALNVAAPLRLRVTALGDNTVLSSMVRLLEQAQFDKPKIALFADRIAQQFLWAMLLLTAGTAVAWWFIDPARMLEAVLAVLVVTCPCALSLAAPTAISAAIHALAKRGLLVTRADAIERLASIKQVWFDKTGTVTNGNMSITTTTLAEGFTLQQALGISVALEAGAHHPVADALRNAHRAALSSAPEDHTRLSHAEALMVVPGMGVEGVIEGERYRLGRASFVAQLRQAVQTNNQVDDRAAHDIDGVVLGNTQRECARFMLSDVLRSDAPLAMTALRHQHIHVALRSGDAPMAVRPIAEMLDITDWLARQTPADKLAAIKQANQGLRPESMNHVAMVGDGINDAPVLAAAHVGIAMGRGTALAQASADMVLVNERLSALPEAIGLARRAQHILQQNLWWAAIYNLTVIPLAACGLVTPWLAALGMSLSSVMVTLNAARLMRMDKQTVSTSTNEARPMTVVDHQQTGNQFA